MHTLTLLTASLNRGISMMNHRPAAKDQTSVRASLELGRRACRQCTRLTQHRAETQKRVLLIGGRPTQTLQKQVLLGPESQIALPRVSPRQTLFARSGERRSCLFERPLGLHFRRLVCRVAALRSYSRRGVKYIRSPFRKAYLCAIAVRLHSFVDPLNVVYTCDRR